MSTTGPRTNERKSTAREWRIRVANTELLFLVFLYFSAYLTGIGALLAHTKDDDAITFISADAEINVTTTTATNATVLIVPGESSTSAVKAVCWVLLIVYTLGPVVIVGGLSNEMAGSLPRDQTGEEYYAAKEEKQREDALFSLIMPYDKKYAFFKSLVLLESGIYACCIELMPNDKTKLITTTAVCGLFLMVSLITRANKELSENHAEISGHVITVSTLCISAPPWVTAAINLPAT